MYLNKNTKIPKILQKFQKYFHGVQKSLSVSSLMENKISAIFIWKN
jgi:hypothetical protein